VHVPLSQEQHELLLGKVQVYVGHRNHMKRQVPHRILTT
jgi:hypothetical protein